ncbi:tetratricopeptide repeat protein [Octadecabacter sp. G9-8]|uniref:Tetratricopeptide repeat protein n=1 Tax=Octadecabacter dasysiphoniae TaxID=2909341 RepID=A0ABS9CYS2_9RHOB|nr:tetratricopeptide repeat protein [Octadecabacter dasysiphoniae]MCF2872051.1 tetratricopeptide repeat protein [Octadecabacter dasysiphoniae]
MAVTRTKLYSVTLGALVLGLAAATLLDLPVDLVEPPPESDELIEAIEAIKSGEAEDEAKANAQEPNVVPMASPCLMRRPRLAVGVDRAWRHGFAAATIATGTTTRAAMLDDLMASAHVDAARWRVDVAFVEMALRADEKEAALAHLANAADRDVPPSCRADEAFFAALLATDRAEAAALLARAVEIDPAFWSALERLALISAEGTGEDAQQCEIDAVRTLESVVQLGALAEKDTQFQRLNRTLEALPANGRTALLRGMILRQTGEREAARAAYQQGLAALGPSHCDGVLRTGLNGMLAATEDEQ